MTLESRIPPPAVMVLVAGAMWAACRWMPALSSNYPGRVAIACGLAALGIAVALAGVFEFRRARTTVDPLHPERATAIVDGGIYRITRNPMYVGMLLGLVAWTMFLGNPLALVGPVAFVLYINRFQISPEERALTQLFGEPYRVYLARVRRWI